MTDPVIRDKDSLDGWVIALCGARSFLGMPTKGLAHERIRLSPVYEFGAQAMANQGGLAIQHGAHPVLFLGSVTELEVRPDAILPCERLSIGDKASLARARRAAEELQNALRLAQSGLAVARAMPPAPVNGRPAR